VLERALDKLPNHEAQVFRGMSRSLPEAQQNIYEKAFKSGEVITEKAFLSTSINKNAAFKGFGEEVQFFILSKTGKSIGDFSRYNGKYTSIRRNEAEVLFASGAKFKVVKYETVEDGKLKIELREV
jgi:hypothetical protein